MECGRFGSALAICIVLMIIVSIPVSAQRPSPSECSLEIKNGVASCKGVIFGLNPSAACCKLVRTFHYECACPVIDAKLATLLTVKIATKGLRDCGRDVPHKFQCGSLYFP
ncbi:uncharacterized protein LOC124913667 [Impatiens glandulifera]|uniref:uncharacterized protein LOC124913667 n=1 Tax=Impatiens glandulifera TaxID=253017 RepID=UPI001FB0B12A|nr:uncharacterized protein LOC124913667 [Impatiens glandulifera]